MAAPAHLRSGPSAGPPVGPGRVYSVWHWGRCEYDYFWDPEGPSDAGGWMARPGAAPTAPFSPHGDPIENLLGELPPGARPVGRGRQAWGEIVVRNREDALAMRGLGLGEGTPGYQPIMDSGLSGWGGSVAGADGATTSMGWAGLLATVIGVGWVMNRWVSV